MLGLIMPAFLTVLFTIQDMVVGNYEMPQRAVFAMIIIASLAVTLVFIFKEYKDSLSTEEGKKGFFRYFFTH